MKCIVLLVHDRLGIEVSISEPPTTPTNLSQSLSLSTTDPPPTFFFLVHWSKDSHRWNQYSPEYPNGDTHTPTGAQQLSGGTEVWVIFKEINFKFLNLHMYTCLKFIWECPACENTWLSSSLITYSHFIKENHPSFPSQISPHGTLLGGKTFQVLLKKGPFEILVLVLTKVSDSNAWVMYSFAYKEVPNFFISIKLEVFIYSSADRPLKNTFWWQITMWSGHITQKKFKEIHDIAVTKLHLFSSTHLCEQGFLTHL